MIKKLSAYIGRNMFSSVMSGVWIAFEVFFSVAIPPFLSRMIDVGIPNHDTRVIAGCAALTASFALGAMFTGSMSAICAARASAGFGLNLRRAVFEKIQSFTFADIDTFSIPGLVTRMTTDITNVQNAFQQLIRSMVRYPLMVVSCFVMAYVVSPKLSIIYPVVFIVYAIALVVLSALAHPHFRRVFAWYDKLNRVTQENVRGIRVVKSFVREDEERRKFNVISEFIYKHFVIAEKIFALNGSMFQFMAYGAVTLVAVLAAHMIVFGQLGVGSLSAVLTYMMLILFAVLLLSSTLLTIVMAITSARRVIEVLDAQTVAQLPADAACDVADGSIEFRGVDFRYSADSRSKALDDINLRIESGQNIGIIGDTGSSKSTLVQLIPRLYDATAGTVLVGGRDVRDYDPATLRDRVAIVLQKNVLFSGTILENLRWGKEDATLEECVRAARLAQIDDFISELPDGYDSRVEQGGSNFSGGQRQRLCIARALLKDPRILILDDSTSAVDTATEAALLRAFAQTLPDVTKLIIAQRISSIQGADAIIVMHAGCIAGFGTHRELYETNEVYRQVYDTQTRKAGV
ncbi:MAG: ABC transporter ATP-binding protein/permease [Actinomycetes bacterium]|jgi:ATP-binding cassette subfamily B protein|nr:ABC transporter ATP-binding protein/permease [Actinomycetes bacterium]